MNERLAAGKKLRGIEISVQQVGAVSLPAVQTANVTLYEKFDVLVMSRDAWEGLSPAQQQELRDAFAEASAVGVAARVTEEEGQADVVRHHGGSDRSGLGRPARQPAPQSRPDH